MDNKKIIEIIENKGATLDKDYKSINKKVGFMVSLYGEEIKTDIKNIEEIKKEIEKKKEKIKNIDNVYIGLWVDNDIMYIDLSIHIIDYMEALEVGRDNKQLAIYDLKNNNSIYLNYIKYYNLYKVIKKDNKIIDYKLIKQYDKKEEIKEEIKASIKTIDNIIYKSFKHYEKRLKDYQGYILISDKITLEEITA